MSRPRVALVGPEIEENLSLRYIASTLERAGIEADIVAVNGEYDVPRAVEHLLATQPAVVGISLAFQWRAQDFLALAVILRERGYAGHVTAGGHFATFEAENILRDFSEIDSICRQEAEETFLALTRAVTAGTSLADVRGLAFRIEGRVVLTEHPALPDLAKLPRPDRRGAPAACFGHGIAPLVSSRGCYANCSFCCIAAWHEQSLPGKRYRIRDVEDVADEMVDMQRTRGVDIFVFHDDNFFVPGHRKNFDRFSALADALERKGIGRFATVVKARPTDVDPRVWDVLKHRLHCIRAYIGIETDADQGLETLQRWSSAKQNRKAIELVRSLDLYTCFNMLLFDPDTTLESIETNVAFMRYARDFPSNFGRVELYAGTPLLDRMKAERRVRGDYLQWDYDLGSPEVSRVFSLAMRVFMPRNFGEGAIANGLMATRFDIEVARKFYPGVFRDAWLARGRALSSMLGGDSADMLGEIVAFVRDGGTDEQALVTRLETRARSVEAAVRRGMRELAQELTSVIGRGAPLTELGDPITGLQPTASHAVAIGA